MKGGLSHLWAAIRAAPARLPRETSPGASLERVLDGAGWDHVRGRSLPSLGRGGDFLGLCSSALPPSCRYPWAPLQK